MIGVTGSIPVAPTIGSNVRVTLRPDGWPQATTVGYVNEDLTLYFLCGLDCQKAANLARDDRVSLTIDHDAPQ
jgi:nitroimidazol reductase NimA-like FMN-containing flavoprotein (pyridoxamine 5'-phosphate oxidase superfamily)